MTYGKPLTLKQLQDIELPAAVVVPLDGLSDYASQWFSKLPVELPLRDQKSTHTGN